MLAVPPGFVVVELPLPPGSDRHALGRRAAEQALATLGAGTLAHEGTRPLVVGAHAAVSITHGKTRVLAVAAPVARVGIDLVDDADADRLARIAPRYLAAECEADLATTPHGRAACFAAKEAALKALGLGLLDGGMFDHCAVHVVSLDPPQLSGGLTLVLGRTADGTVALAYER